MRNSLKYRIVELNLFGFLINFEIWNSTYFFHNDFFQKYFFLTSFEIPFFLGCIYLIFLKKAIYIENIVKVVTVVGALNNLAEWVTVACRIYTTVQAYHTATYDDMYFILFILIVDMLNIVVCLLTFHCCKLIQAWHLVCKTENREEIVSLVRHQ